MVNIFIHIIILISLIFAGCASTPPTQTFTLPTNSLAERISAVESHIPVKERFKWNEKTITDRMEHYNVPGVSIAVVNNNKIEWAFTTVQF